jgi:hypothetical protein
MQRIVESAMRSGAESNDRGSEKPSSSDMKTITLYRNGFTVDHGPLRDLESPENKSFLQDLSLGYVPQEVSSSRSNLYRSFDISHSSINCHYKYPDNIHMILLLFAIKIYILQR